MGSIVSLFMRAALARCAAAVTVFLSGFANAGDILVKMSDDALEVLARYSRQHAEDAFAEIVRRDLDLVFSAALRQVCGLPRRRGLAPGREWRREKTCEPCG
jgi:hypothetical protein